MRIKKPALAPALLTGLLVLLTSCSNSDSDTAQSADTPDQPASSASAATGDPLKIGVVNQEGGATGDFISARLAMEAAVEYINQEAGGISGRPLEVMYCTADGTPERSQACANEMVSGGVVSVTFGQDLGASAAMPIYEDAGIPVVGGAPVSPAELTSESAFFFSGAAPTQLAAMADYAVRSVDAEKVTGIFVDVATPFWDAYIKLPVEQLGAQVQSVTGANGAPDWTPQASQAIASGADSLLVLGPPADCLNIVKALGSLGNTIPTTFTGSCVGNNFYDEAGSAAVGTFYTQEQTPLDQTDDPEVQLFKRVMETYSEVDEEDYDAYSELGFQAMMVLWEQYNEIGADNLTGPAIIDHFKSTADGNGWLSTDWNCTGELYPPNPALCHGESPIYEWDGESLVLVEGDWNGLKYLPQ